MKLSTCIHQFFEKYLPQIKGVSPNTIKAYRDTFKQFLPFAANYHGIKVASLSLDHLAPELILAFLDYLESERKNTPKTRNHRLAAIKSMTKMIRFMYPQKTALVEKNYLHTPKAHPKAANWLFVPRRIRSSLKCR